VRTLSSLLKTALVRRSRPHVWFLVEFPNAAGIAESRQYTNYHRQFVYLSKTWTPLPDITLKGVGETLNLSSISGELRLPGLDAALQARFLADEFRGEKCVVRILSQEPGASIVDASTVWTTTYTCGADSFDEDGVTIALEPADAVEGTEVPRRQVSQIGCQWDYMRGGCPYRGHRTFVLNSVTRAVVSSSVTVFPNCRKTIEDGPAIDGTTMPGCKSHFPGIPNGDPNAYIGQLKGTLNPDFTLGSTPRWIRRPLPYSAFPGEATQVVR